MHTARRSGGMLVALLLAMGNALAVPVPPVLEPWRGWVLHGHEEETCPAQAGNGTAACAWPGELRIDAGADGARFTQRWTVYARRNVPLPGDGDDFGIHGDCAEVL